LLLLLLRLLLLLLLLLLLVQIALSSVDLLQFWQSVPVPLAHTQRQRCVYGDFHAQQFGVTADYVVKQLDVDAKDFHCYESYDEAASGGARTPAASHRLGELVECRVDKDCFDYFSSRDLLGRLWQTTSGGVGQSARLPSEVGCDERTRRCRGLDGAINVYALCSMLLRHLLVSVPLAANDDNSTVLTQFVDAAQRVVGDCTRNAHDKRLSPIELRRALLNLAPLAAAVDTDQRTSGAAVAMRRGDVDAAWRYMRDAAQHAPRLDVRPTNDFNKLKRAFLRIEMAPRANATALSLQVDALRRENGLLRARIRQLERAAKRFNIDCHS
jgi:hypothetical protein